MTQAAAESNEPIDVTGLSKEQLKQYVGRIVTVQGKFSLSGVIGPFIQFAGGAIYLQSKPNHSWGPEHERMQGREVRAMARLSLEHFEPSDDQHPPDYFFSSRHPDCSNKVNYQVRDAVQRAHKLTSNCWLSSSQRHADSLPRK